MKKILTIIAVLMLNFSCIAFAGVMQVDTTSYWKFLGTNDDHYSFYADVNPNNIKIRSNDNRIIEYQLIVINQDYNGTGYVYQVDHEYHKARFIYRVKIRNNEIVDNYTWIQDWQDVSTNSFVWEGSEAARAAKGV